ncbi:Uncharacterized protein XB17_02806 [Leptospira santarosai]|nr:Uncharacterized protein XB17_02806 [Leptospira santarosai]
MGMFREKNARDVIRFKWLVFSWLGVRRVNKYVCKFYNH